MCSTCPYFTQDDGETCKFCHYDIYDALEDYMGNCHRYDRERAEEEKEEEKWIFE